MIFYTTTLRYYLFFQWWEAVLVGGTSGFVLLPFKG